MNPPQQNLDDPNVYSSTSLDTTFNISSNTNAAQDKIVVLDNMSTATTMLFNINNNQSSQQIISPNLNQNYQATLSSLSSNIHPQETVVFAEYSFFYKPPNDFQIYNIICKETPVSFELVSQLLSSDNQNGAQSSDLHEFHFLKHDEKKCYKVTCELISHSLIVKYLNNNIHGIEVKQDEYQHQEEFSRELKENLESYLRQFFTRHLTSK